MSPVLRLYQQRLLEQLAAATDKRILIVCPTGGGKTIVAAALVAKDFVAAGRPVLALAHRREIVEQTVRSSMPRHRAGIIQAGVEPGRPMAAVQVASVQTLHARAMRGSIEMPRPTSWSSTKRTMHRARATAHRRGVSRRHRARADGHAMPGRWSGPRRHLRDDDRVPAGRRP